uniref:Threonine aldolase n=1 Tax=Angomonas desouzai TaxID=59800 RepID=U5KM52_9TRYP|nr:threonine aldolase [Angomonas desouzai]
MIDLRSDTFTVPTDEMRQVMANAPVGDDVFGEDPSCNKLEAECAKLLGKEAALFACSGTMGNLIAVMTHAQSIAMPEIVIGKDAHVMRLELGGISSLARASTYQLANNEDGTFADMEELREVVHRPPSIVKANVIAVCLENTYGTTGGRVLPMEYVNKVRAICDSAPRKVYLHCDGARLWNAAVALNLPLHEVAAPYDTVQVCLSKGLGAPVGSVLAGPADFIARARHVRKLIGGGMRQAGILAAAGLYAIEHHFQKLKFDHEHCALLASTIASRVGHLPQVKVHLPETNMCFIDLPSPAICTELIEACKKENVLLYSYSSHSARMVATIHHTKEDMEKAADVVSQNILRIVKS